VVSLQDLFALQFLGYWLELIELVKLDVLLVLVIDAAWESIFTIRFILLVRIIDNTVPP